MNNTTPHINIHNIHDKGKYLREGSGGEFEITQQYSSILIKCNVCISAKNEDVFPVNFFVFCGNKCIYERKSSIQTSNHNDTHFEIQFENIDESLFNSIECFALSSTGFLYRLDTSRVCANLQLEASGRCNMRCPQCPNTRYSGFHGMDCTPSEYAMAIPIMARSTTMCLDGFGESLLAPAFDEILAAIPWHKWLYLHTNGILLGAKSDVLLHHAPPLRQIYVSLDSLSPSRYATLRPGGSLDKIVSAMRAFKQERIARNQIYPLIVPNLTLSMLTYDGLLDFVELAESLDGILEVTTLYDPAPSENTLPWGGGNYEAMLPRNNPQTLHNAMREALALARRKGVWIHMGGYTFETLINPSADPYGSLVDKKDIRDCPMKSSASIQMDGKVMLCVWQTSSVFNWRTAGTMDPLETSRCKTIVELMNNGIIPFECGGSSCPYVARRASDEAYAPPAVGDFAGGWQV